MNLDKLLKKVEAKVKKWINKLLAKYLPDSGSESSSSSSDSDSTQPPSTDTGNDEVDFGLFDFCWGGFNGKKATLDPNAAIKGLDVKVSNNKMTYSWRTKIDGLWGMGHSEAKALACLFVPQGSKWVGGKFDWISVSRTSRDLNNIRTGYNGWDWGKFSSSKQFAFVIVSGDSKHRTNVITCSAKSRSLWQRMRNIF